MVTVKMYHTKAELPKKGHQRDLAYDYKATERELNFPWSVKYKLGIGLQDEHGGGFYVFPRSNVATRGMWLANSVGLIDPDYTGEISVIFYTQLRAWLPGLERKMVNGNSLGIDYTRLEIEYAKYKVHYRIAYIFNLVNQRKQCEEIKVTVRQELNKALYSKQ